MTWLLSNPYFNYGMRRIDAFTQYYKLVIPNVQFKHAGEYGCLGHDEENHLFQGVGELVVKGK